ncbi:hypothetical protein HDV04_003513 [Boothiomyces sp. JEL0838]|nr:hypothetical protein HDV04_003513 [Boothiomyces sp. JEL0838]
MIQRDLTNPLVSSGDKGNQSLTIVQERVSVFDNAYEATTGADAIVIVTEWDEFKQLNYRRIYDEMKKPAFLFDGRSIVDYRQLEQIGFKVHVVGKAL